MTLWLALGTPPLLLLRLLLLLLLLYYILPTLSNYSYYSSYYSSYWYSYSQITTPIVQLRQLRRQELPSCNASKDGTSPTRSTRETWHSLQNSHSFIQISSFLGTLVLHQLDWCLHVCNMQVCVSVSKDPLTSPNLSWSKELRVKW